MIFIVAPRPPFAVEVRSLEQAYNRTSGVVMISALINPPAHNNITATVDYRCIGAGCSSVNLVNIPQCNADIPGKCLFSLN